MKVPSATNLGIRRLQLSTAAVAPRTAHTSPRRLAAPLRAADGAAAADPRLPAPSAGDEAVAQALRRVQVAIGTAEVSLEKVQELPSARLPTIWDAIFRTIKPLLQTLLLLAACFSVHFFNPAAQAAGSCALALAIAARGYRRSSLSASGALAAWVVGWATLGSSFRAGVSLIAFFLVSSQLTRLGDDAKAVDEDHKKGGQRDWVQVASFLSSVSVSPHFLSSSFCM
jgi:hypothetical protein